MDARRRFFVRRFVGCLVFAVVSVLALLVGATILAFSLARQGTMGPAEGLIVLACVAAPILIVMIAMGAFALGHFGSPLAELMVAADAVAAGDLSVRVGDNGRGEMARLARRFNRMVDELARAEQGRRNLTADVAHELRTPLQIIQGNLEGVLDGVYEPTPDHIAATLDETRLLGRLVNDLQTLSLAEAGQLPLHPRPILARDLLDDAVTRFMPAAAEAGVTLKIAPGDDDLTLTVDADRLDQVLTNLIGNALRHTPAGGRVTLSAQAANGGVALAVADTGAGIDPADLPHVFDRFWRGDRSRTRARDGAGSGLGLAIARQLVRAHGGDIEVTSAPGEGATFTVYLPE